MFLMTFRGDTHGILLLARGWAVVTSNDGFGQISETPEIVQLLLFIFQRHPWSRTVIWSPQMRLEYLDKYKTKALGGKSILYFQTCIRLRERLIYHDLTSYLWPLIFWYILLLFLKPLVSSNFHSFHSLDFPDQYMLKMLSLVPCLSESFWMS